MKKGFLRTTTSTNASIGLLILRVGFGAMLLTHGYPKLMKIIEGNMQFGDPLGLGSGTSLVLSAFAEFLCSILVILGIYTRISVIPIIINFATAVLIVHAADDFATKEKAILYLLAFVAILFTGPGKYSVDRKL